MQQKNVSTETYLEKIIPLMKKGKRPVDIIKETGIGKNTVYRLYKKYKDEITIEEYEPIINPAYEESHPEQKEDFVHKVLDESDYKQNLELSYAKNFAHTLRYSKEIIDGLPDDYKTIGEMNIEMQRLLHKMEDVESESQLLEVAKELYSLRRKRRILKNRYRLGYQLRSIFCDNKTHSNNLINVSDAFLKVIDSIENNKEYTKHDDHINNDNTNENDVIYISKSQNDDNELEEWKKNVISIVETQKALN